MDMDIHNDNKTRLALVIALVMVFALFGVVQAYAAESDFSEVSLSTLEAITDASDVKPIMYFEPDYFGLNSGNYPVNGGEYKLDNPNFNELLGRGPHGGYDTTTSKCGVCHSAHAAQSTTDAGGDFVDRHLIREGATGCEYCHLTGSVIGGSGQELIGEKSSSIVYPAVTVDGEIGMGGAGHAITGEAVDAIPASDIEDFVLTCTSCHTVHGSVAGAWLPTDFWGPDGQDGNPATDDTTDVNGYKLLRANPSGVGDPAPNSGPAVGNYVADTDTVNQYTYSVWCATCHNQALKAQTVVLSEDATFTVDEDNGSAGIHDSSKKIAVDIDGSHDSVTNGIYSGPTQCYSCHRAELPDTEEFYDFDDATLAKIRARGYFPGTEAELDENIKCSRCHYGTADFAYAAASGHSYDWPHADASGGKALLGTWTRDEANVASEGELVAFSPTAPSNWVTEPTEYYVCRRCHVSDIANGDAALTSDPQIFTISYHDHFHTFTFSDADGTTGSLEATYSPGYPVTP
jgi:hypothetical protein